MICRVKSRRVSCRVRRVILYCALFSCYCAGLIIRVFFFFFSTETAQKG